MLSLACSQPTKPVAIVLVTVESLRTDHLLCYGGSPATSPNLDALAAESMVYTDAHAVTSWTLASHASLFTGLYPSAHGATKPLSRLAEPHRTLAEALAGAGYQTSGVVSGPYLLPEHGLDQGFEYYDSSPASVTHDRAHADVTSGAMLASLDRFLTRERDPLRPLFLFAYFWDPHYDYLPPHPYSSMFVNASCEPFDVSHYESSPAIQADMPAARLQYVLAQYDGEIRWTDRHLGRFFRRLRELGLWDDALVIVTADHGEEFFEHGNKGHKHNLYKETTHVPLIVKYPGGARRGTDTRLVSLIDVMPTVLECVEVPFAGPLQGESLLEPRPRHDRAILLELDSVWYDPESSGHPTPVEERWSSVIRDARKLLRLDDGAFFRLYDRSSDPFEQEDIAPYEPEVLAAMRSELDDLLERSTVLSLQGDDASDAALGSEALQRLRDLGYVR